MLIQDQGSLQLDGFDWFASPDRKAFRGIRPFTSRCGQKFWLVLKASSDRTYWSVKIWPRSTSLLDFLSKTRWTTTSPITAVERDLLAADQPARLRSAFTGVLGALELLTTLQLELSTRTRGVCSSR